MKEVDRKKEEEIVSKYLGLIRRIAGHYGLGNKELVEDLIQEGCIGLIESWRRYNPEKGPFENYANSYIRGFILRALGEEPIIKVPSRKKFLRKKVYEIVGEHNGKVSIKEIAEEMRNKGEPCSADTIIESLKGVSYVQSLDENIVGEDGNIDTSLYLTEVLNLELKNLSPEEREVLTVFYKNDLSISATEEELGLPRKKIKQVISKINRKVINKKLKK